MSSQTSRETSRGTNDETSGEITNRAKRRLRALDAEKAAAVVIVRRIDQNAHFAAAPSRFAVVAGIVILLLTAGEIYYLAVRSAPLSLSGFLSLLTSVGIAGFLIRRFAGLRCVRADERKLAILQTKIAAETEAAENLLADNNQ